MKLDKTALKKFIYVFVFCIICVIISRVILLGIYCNKTGKISIREYILAFNQWDSEWYDTIIENGYQAEPSGHADGNFGNGDAANWAFFPLMPMVIKALSNVFQKSHEIIGPLVNTAVFTLALVIAWYYLEETRNKKVASLFVFLMTLGMYSFYFSSLYTESFYLLFMVSFLYAMKKEKYVLMGISGALAAATRNTGIMLVFAVIPYVIVKYLKQNEGKKFSLKELFLYVIKQPKLILGVCIVPLGLFSYMLYLYLKMGDGLAFVHIQRAWVESHGTMIDIIYEALKSICDVRFYHALWAIWGFISVYHLFKNKRYDEGILSLIFLVIPLSTKMQSIPRYLIGSFFPVVSMCDMIEKKNNFEIGTFLVMAMVMEHILYCDWIIAAPYLC